MSKGNVEISLYMNSETNEIIQQMCDDGHMSLSDLFKKSLALMMIALKYKKNGHHLVAMDNNDQKISEIIGI